MASGSESSDPSSFFDRLFSSQNRENLSMFLPYMLSLSNPQNSSTPDENSTNPDQNNPQLTRERLILINPFTQTMLVIESSNSDRDSSNNSGFDFDSWINDLLSRKDGQPPASKASMEAMPDVEIGEEGLECVICLEDFEVGGMGKEMPCKHRFHGGCIDKWLKIHGTCPVCRYKMPVEEKDDTSVKNEENQNTGRRRGVWMGFSFEDDVSDNNNPSESAAESADDSSRTDLDMEG